MKASFLKIATLTMLGTTLCFAGPFEDNLTKILSETGHTVKIISSKPLVGMNDMRIVNVEFSNKTGAQRTPFLATPDGKGAIVFSTLFFTADQKSNSPIIEEVLREIDQFNESKKNAELNKLFKGMSKDRFVELPATGKNITKTTIIVSSPDCPYCRDELQKIDERRKESHVKMVIVPLSGQESSIKAQIAVNETKKYNDPAQKIKALNRVYEASYQIPAKERKTDVSFVNETAEMVFKSGLIRGVPYIHVLEN